MTADPVTVITTISAGLKLIDQFGDLAKRFMDQPPQPPAQTLEQAGNTMELRHNGKVVQRRAERRKAEIQLRRTIPSNKRSVRMFAATSGGKGCHVLPTSRRPSFVLISFGSEESRPSGLPHLQPNQYDRAERCPHRRAFRRDRH